MHGAMAGNRCSPRRRSGVRTRALSQPATPHEPHIRSTRPTSDSTPCDLTSSRAPPIALSLRPAAAAKERRARCLDRALPTNHTWCFSTPLSPRRFVWSIALSRGGGWRRGDGGDDKDGKCSSRIALQVRVRHSEQRGSRFAFATLLVWCSKLRRVAIRARQGFLQLLGQRGHGVSWRHMHKHTRAAVSPVRTPRHSHIRMN